MVFGLDNVDLEVWAGLSIGATCRRRWAFIANGAIALYRYTSQYTRLCESWVTHETKSHRKRESMGQYSTASMSYPVGGYATLWIVLDRARCKKKKYHGGTSLLTAETCYIAFAPFCFRLTFRANFFDRFFFSATPCMATLPDLLFPTGPNAIRREAFRLALAFLEETDLIKQM